MESMKVADSLPFNSYGAISVSPTLDLDVRAGKVPSFFSAYNIGHTCNTLILLLGASIFSLPWSYYESGVIGGVLITWFASFISLQTALAMLSAQRTLYFQSGKVLDFPEIAAEYLGGGNWAVVIKVATTISCVGGCAGYLIFIAQLCSQELGLPLAMSVFILCIPITLLCWIRSFQELHIYTMFGVFAVTLSVFAITYDAYPVDRSALNYSMFDAVPAMGFLGTATFLFTVHYCILSMGAEILLLHDTTSSGPGVFTGSSSSLATTSLDILMCPIATGWILGTLLVTCLGLVGPFLYSGSDLVRDPHGDVTPGCENVVCQNIVLNLPNGELRLVVVCVLVASMMIAYPMLIAPARDHVERFALYCAKEGGVLVQEGRAMCWARNMMRTTLVAITAYIATQAPYFGAVLRTVGGFTDAFQSYVIPSLVGIIMFRSSGAEGMAIGFHVFVLLWGSGLMVFTLIQTIHSIYGV